ncbi:dna-directed rna polymerase i largest, partial [Cystoisospora suis]
MSLGGGMPLLHPRTATLLELLKINEKVQFAINILRHHDPIRALENPELWLELFEGTSSSTILSSKEDQEEEDGEGEEEKMEKKKIKKTKEIEAKERGKDEVKDRMEKNKKEGGGSLAGAASALSLEEREKLQEFVLTHAAGNSTWLTKYAVQLQQKVNEISDKTKAEKPAAAFGGVRQWLERKAGTIRQKMMGKRVNYAARTVLAPDALIGTNEVGIPLEFAMKLSIPEKV